MNLAQRAAAERAARQKYADADAESQTAWNRWYRDDTQENWGRYEQAGDAARDALRELSALTAQPHA